MLLYVFWCKNRTFSRKCLVVQKKVPTFASLSERKPIFKIVGEMSEWSNVPVLKTGVPQGTGGSNPSLSAKLADFQRVFFFTANFTAKN